MNATNCKCPKCSAELTGKTVTLTRVVILEGTANEQISFFEPECVEWALKHRAPARVLGTNVFGNACAKTVYATGWCLVGDRVAQVELLCGQKLGK